MKRKTVRGQSLIGVLIALALLVILASALFTLTNTSYSLVSFNRSRITARHLALERIELVRNLPFDDVGTVGGIPSGVLEQSESVVRNGLSYTIQTSIVYIDDPFDGEAPDDLLPTDYKRVRVDVSWEGLSPSRGAPVVLATDIAPRGIETAVGGGTLSILVFDANALPVSQADVQIQAGELDPPIDLSLQTNDNGRIILPGTPICIECYTITVTKEEYSSDKTYSTAEVANPEKPLQTILEGEVTEISFAIDKVSTLDISSVDDRESGFSPRANVDFTLQGQRTIGTDIDDFPVYKYSEDLTTDENGFINIPDLEWDNYSIILPIGSGTVISGTNPIVPLSLLPDTDIDLSFALSDETPHSLLNIFTDGVDPVASVSATLSDGGGFEESKFTGGPDDPDYGQVFFPGLTNTTYTLEATASGFFDFVGNVNVSGYSTGTIILNPE